jgi:hypothetical protein
MLPNLHDATHQTVTIEWATGVARITVATEHGPRVVVARGLREFRGTRLHPWGPSVSINEARESRGATGLQEPALELQSGDVLEFVAETFEAAPDLVGPPRS